MLHNKDRASRTGYNFDMNPYKFHHTIEVRYGDLDPQWHVNNARFLTFLEHARFYYLMELGLFDGKDFWALPLIVGDIHCRYLAPIEAGSKVEVWMGVTKIGNSSLVIGCEMTSEDGKVVYATLENTMVGYDYLTKRSALISPEMRKRISEYEGKDFSKKAG